MAVDIFFILVFVILIILAIKSFFRRFPIPILPMLLFPSNAHSIKELLLFFITNKETRTRLCITLGVLLVIRILAFIPTPGINQEAFSSLFQDTNNIIFGSFTRFSIASLGIMPFISACFLIQLLSVVIPPLKKATFGDEEGRRKIVRYTLFLTVGLALVQSYGMSTWLENTMGHQGTSLVTMQGVPFRIITMATLTATVFLYLFLADLINKYGIGNGIALMIVTGAILGVFPWIYQGYNSYGEIGIVRVFGIILLVVGSLYVAFFFTSREKKIVLKDKKTNREITIPLRVSWVAKGPLFLHSMIIHILFLTILNIIQHPYLQSLSDFFIGFTVSSFIVKGALLLMFTYIYASIIFRPQYLQSLFQRYNFVLKSTEGKKPAAYFDDHLSKLLIITFLLLFIFHYVPLFIQALLPSEYFLVSTVGALSILVLVGVFFDLLSQLEFFYQKSKASSKNLTVAYIAFDEIEAKIKSEYLKGKGINALVEPLRFTWGIPIRTAIDQYRIYTSARDVKKARKLIE